jgi:hypothetical protein
VRRRAAAENQKFKVKLLVNFKYINHFFIVLTALIDLREIQVCSFKSIITHFILFDIPSPKIWSAT